VTRPERGEAIACNAYRDSADKRRGAGVISIMPCVIISSPSWSEAQALAIPPLLRNATGFRLECVLVDVMHACDLGICAAIMGNVLWILAVRRRVFGGRTMADAVELMQIDLKAWYTQVKENSRLKGKLSVARLRGQDGYPKLKAKAAATRHMLPYAISLMKRFAVTDGGSDEKTHDDRATLVMGYLQRFYDILYEEGQLMTQHAKSEIAEVGRRLAVIYVALARDSLRAETRLWKPTPKLHVFVHLCEWQSLLNPRSFWCYADEDLVGLMVEVAESVHPRTVAASAMFKWIQLSFSD